jgi:glucose-1-phosphate thymidylyltransferase
MKAIVLSGGKGTRLRPLTYTGAKQLVPIANRPILSYVIDNIARVGIKEVGIIISPETGSEVKETMGDGDRWGINITYIMQDEPKGLAHAVRTAAPFLGQEPFVMYLGDNLLKEGIAPFVRTFEENDPDALILLQKVTDPQSYGIAELDGNGCVARLVEKPREPRSDLALVGVYLFTPAVFESVKAIAPSARGELEITDAIQHMVDRGLRVEPHVVTGWWKDTGKLEDMLEANRLVLSTLVGEVRGELRETTLEGPVQIGEGSVLERCTVRGPVVIGAGCRLSDTFVGPYTSISDGVVVDHAEIEHSIVLENSRISHLPTRMADSLIGRDCVIAHSDARPVAYRFLVGDSCQIGIL